jgi:hypothetical protein
VAYRLHPGFLLHHFILSGSSVLATQVPLKDKIPHFLSNSNTIRVIGAEETMIE